MINYREEKINLKTYIEFRLQHFFWSIYESHSWEKKFWRNWHIFWRNYLWIPLLNHIEDPPFVPKEKLEIKFQLPYKQSDQYLQILAQSKLALDLSSVSTWKQSLQTETNFTRIIKNSLPSGYSNWKFLSHFLLWWMQHTLFPRVKLPLWTLLIC